MSAAQLAVPRASFAVLLMAIVLVSGVVGAFVYLPSATVTVTPATTPQTIEQTVTLSADAGEPDFMRYILPARVVGASVEERKAVARDGGDVTEDFATGLVTLHNKQDEEQPLLPKTHLRHVESGTFFLTDSSVRLPVQGELTISVTAKEQGASGNVPPGRFVVDKLPESLQEFVYGESSTQFTGGEIIANPLSEGEIAAARDDVKQRSEERLVAELSTAAGGAGVVPGLTSTTDEELTVSAEPGSKATSFTATSKLTGKAFVIDENDLLGLAALALRANPEGDKDFVSYDPASFDVEIIRADFERGEAQVRVQLTGNFSSKAEAAVFDASNLAGRTEPEVIEYFQQFESVGEVSVDLSPFWVRTIPARPTATEIVVKSTAN